MSFLDKYSEAEIAQYVRESTNFAEVLNKMGQSSNSGSNRLLISHYTKEHNIDTTHFPFTTTRTPQNVFIENSTAGQATVRRHYKRGQYTEYKCAICGLEPFWNGKELVLTLDHINGVNNDHRLENLRWICPNCDRQLPTYGTKRHKKHFYCKQCGKELPHQRKTGLCQTCFQNKNPKKRTNKHNCVDCGALVDGRSERCQACEMKHRTQNNMQILINKGITREFLKNEIRTKSFLQIAKEQKVTDNTIKKWCKRFNLPFRKTDINAISDEEWIHI